MSKTKNLGKLVTNKKQILVDISNNILQVNELTKLNSGSHGR